MVLINFSVFDEVKNETIPFTYDEDTIMETFIKDYLKKYTDYESLDTKIYVFKSGLKILNSKKYLSEKIGTHISEGSQVTFLRKMGLHYSI